MNTQQQQIQRYYDKTTRWFIQFGSTRTHGSIHRALHIDGKYADDPTQIIHLLIKESIEMCMPTATALLDLGCGVGASLHALGSLLPQLQLRHGVTLSQLQASIALQSHAHVAVASYHALPYPSQSIDVAIAIESLIHSDQPLHFWREVQRVLRPGGLLIICDDMVHKLHSYISLFQRGWHAPNLHPVAQHVELAQCHGFEVNQLRDLTPYLRIVPVPDVLMHLMQRVYHRCEPFPLLTSTIGSTALQYLLAQHAIAYTYMVLQRQ